MVETLRSQVLDVLSNTNASQVQLGYLRAFVEGIGGHSTPDIISDKELSHHVPEIFFERSHTQRLARTRRHT
jgi:hypothetical protein